MDVQDWKPVRQARSRFAAMAGAFALGVFNDNFFKQAAMLLAPSVLRDELQSWATVIFAAPFMVFAAHAGWLADRFSKRRVIIASKALELAAMLIGAVGVLRGDFTLMLVMLGIMGTQSAIFSPALAGSIPELYPGWYVTRANGLLKVASTAAILAGVGLAGVTLDQTWTSVWGVPAGNAALAAGVVLVAAMGLAVALGVPRRPAADPKAAFPWSGPMRTLADLWHTRSDRLLRTVIVGDAYFWFLGSLEILMINSLGRDELGMSNSMTSALAVAPMVGIAVGGVLAGRLAVGPRWHRVLAPSLAALSVLMLLAWAAATLDVPLALRAAALLAVLAAMGVAGGLFMVPQEAFVQTRPPLGRKGAIIAAANFLAFGGILLSGPLNWMMSSAGLAPSRRFAAAGALSAAVTVWLWLSLRRGSAGSAGAPND
jgi:MFS family permease